MNIKSISHVPSLDGVRAVAALMVMFFHFFQNYHPVNYFSSIIKTVSGFGQTGVSLFFVLSGFLITRILIKDKQSKNYFLNFYLRRSLRIFPLYYYYLLLVFFIVPFINHTDVPEFSKQIYHWVYLQDFAITFKWDYSGPLHFWSLAVEEHFYLFFPLLVYYLKENQLIYAVIIILMSSIVVRFILNAHNFEVFYFTFSRLDELSLGAVLAILELRNKLTSKSSFQYIYLFALVALPTFILWGIYSKEANSLMQVMKYSLISVTYFCAIAFIVSAPETNFVKQALTVKPLIYIGKISYGLYVYHGLCFHNFKHIYHGNNDWIIFFGSFSLAIIVSTISFYLFESHFLKFKNYFIPKTSN
jgi:peptidoglycan/LPS O-acetylase OafA/YrhL